MRNLFLIAAVTILSLFALDINAAQNIHVDKHLSNPPKVQWISRYHTDEVQIQTDGAPYNLLITNDLKVDGDFGCGVNITGCQTVTRIESGDSALCVPTASGIVVIDSRCRYIDRDHPAAAGTVQFIKK